MLKLEEEKAMRKIKNTKEKAASILQMRQENEKKIQDRILVLRLVSRHRPTVLDKRASYSSWHPLAIMELIVSMHVLLYWIHPFP